MSLNSAEAGNDASDCPSTTNPATVVSGSTAEIRAGAGSSTLMSDAAISPIRHGPCRQGRIRGTQRFDATIEVCRRDVASEEGKSLRAGIGIPVLAARPEAEIDRSGSSSREERHRPISFSSTRSAAKQTILDSQGHPSHRSRKKLRVSKKLAEHESEPMLACCVLAKNHQFAIRVWSMA